MKAAATDSADSMGGIGVHGSPKRVAASTR